MSNVGPHPYQFDLQEGEPVPFSGILIRRGLAAWTGAVLLTAVGVAAPSHAALVPPAVGSFMLSNVASGKYLDVTRASIASGVPVVQEAQRNSAAQAWTLAQRTSGVFTLANVNSGLCLEPESYPAVVGVSLVQQSCTGSSSQDWTIQARGAGYGLQAVASGLWADISGGSTTSGAPLVLADGTSAGSQQWNFTATSIARVAGWGTSLAAGGPTFSDQTIRMVAVPTVAGDGARVTLSNKYGKSALSVATVTVAKQGVGAATASTPVFVRFNGSKKTVIPAGEELASDPFTFALAPGQPLLVSVAVAGTTPSSSFHNRANETNYVANGNVAEATEATGFAARTQSFFLKGIDAVTLTQRAAVVTLGDSITDGYGSDIGERNRWPDLLAGRLGSEAGAPALSVVNSGIASNRVLTSGGTRGEAATIRFGQDVLGHKTVKSVFLFEGINDIGDGTSAAAIIAGYKNIIAQARAAGLKVHMGTITPWKGVASYTVAKEAVRSTVNAWIRAGGEPGYEVDYVADFDAAIRDSIDPLKLNPAYDCGDHIHPNASGYAAIANSIDLSKL